MSGPHTEDPTPSDGFPFRAEDDATVAEAAGLDPADHSAHANLVREVAQSVAEHRQMAERRAAWAAADAAAAEDEAAAIIARIEAVTARLVRLTDRDTLWVLSRLALSQPERVEQAIDALIDAAHERALPVERLSHLVQSGEPMSQQCREGKHPTLLGDVPCGGGGWECSCWCHGGARGGLRPLRWTDLEDLGDGTDR